MYVLLLNFLSIQYNLTRIPKQPECITRPPRIGSFIILRYDLRVWELFALSCSGVESPLCARRVISNRVVLAAASNCL